MTVLLSVLTTLHLVLAIALLLFVTGALMTVTSAEQEQIIAACDVLGSKIRFVQFHFSRLIPE